MNVMNARLVPLEVAGPFELLLAAVALVPLDEFFLAAVPCAFAVVRFLWFMSWFMRHLIL